MRQHPHLPLEDDAYLQVIVAYNLAIGHCLGCVIATAEGYDHAYDRLLNSDWPVEAEQTATPCVSQFPELAALFTAQESP